MQNLTVGQIAERIRRPHEGMTTVVDRLRGWTDIGLLKVLARSEANPGAGRKRAYPETAVIDALLLTGLLNAGLSPMRFAQLKSEAGASVLSLGRQAAKQAKLHSDKAYYLVVFGRPSEQKLSAYSAYFQEAKPGDPAKIVEDAEWSVVLNVSVLLQSLSKQGGTRG